MSMTLTKRFSDEEELKFATVSAVSFAAFVLVEKYYQGITEVIRHHLLFTDISQNIIKVIKDVRTYCYADHSRDSVLSCGSSRVLCGITLTIS